MPDTALQLTVRTPSEVVLDEVVDALRVPVESGQVGLRPRAESAVFAIESGIIVSRRDGRERYIGTAGGLLTCFDSNVVLLTPFAVVGDDEQQLQAELERQLSQPRVEMTTRTTLAQLEGRILKEIREERKAELRQKGIQS